MTIEQLTDEERKRLPTRWATVEDGAKALRIIDAHAADRAALVAQLEAEQQHSRDTAGAYAEKSEALILAEAKVAELTRERDEARAEADESLAALVRADAEVTRLTEALAAAKADDQLSRTQRDVLQAEVGRLKEALAAANRGATENGEAADTYRERVDAAESECAALRAELQKERDRRVEHRQMNQSLNEQAASLRAEVERLTAHRERLAVEAGQLRAAWGSHVAEIASLKKELAETTDDALKQRVEYWRESSQAAEAGLAAANALLAEAKAYLADPGGAFDDRIDAHLAAQPATAPPRTEAECPSKHTCWQGQAVRTEAEQRVLDAMAVVKIVRCCGVPMISDAREADLCRAELARRGILRG